MWWAAAGAAVIVGRREIARCPCHPNSKGVRHEYPPLRRPVAAFSRAGRAGRRQRPASPRASRTISSARSISRTPAPRRCRSPSSAPSRCCTRSGTARPRRPSATCSRRIRRARIATWGIAAILMSNPLAGIGLLATGGGARAGGDRPGAADRREDAARARLHRGRRRVLRGLGEPPRAHASAQPCPGLRGAGRALSRRRRGADLLRALPRRHAVAGRPDLRDLSQGGGDPREAVRQASGPSRRRALPDPQLRLPADRAEGAAGRAPLCGHRARAPHALHMPSHIFTRVGAWERIDRDQPALGRSGQAGPGRRRGAARHRLHGVRLPAARARRATRAR